MSGTIPLSMTQQMDQYGDPLSGGRLYFYVAGTVSTPQNAYQDSTLTLPHPNPITLDATGRVPQLFLADGLIKIRLTDAAGVVQLVADNITVIGASSGSVSGGAIDPTTIYQTGDLKPRYDTGVHTGWVRGNGRTIGDTASGASELASDTLALALYTHLWNVDPNLVVSGGARGPNANADWIAHRTIALPDLRGVVLAGMDDMGNTPNNVLTTTYFGADATVLGAVGGYEFHGLTTTQTPVRSHQHVIHDVAGSGNAGGTTNDGGVEHKHYVYRYNSNVAVRQYDGGSSVDVPWPGGGRTQDEATSDSSVYIHKHDLGLAATVNVLVNGFTDLKEVTGNTAHPNVQRTMVATIYIKL